MTLFEQKYNNTTRTISGLVNIPFQDDVVLECNTTLGAVAIQLLTIPANKWSTIWKLYIVDKNNNASVNNITIIAPIGYTINGASSFIINANGGCLLIRVSSNVSYLGQYSVLGSGIINAYSTIQEEGVSLPQRNIINFVGDNITATDDGSSKTIVTIGSEVSDLPFSPLWNGVTGIAPSQNAVYDKIITIGAGFGNTAFVRTSGDDTTAIVGNYLLPFQTIGSAITALGTLSGSTLYIDAGTYTLNDVDTPFGLKAPNSLYDVYCAVGCQIDYYGTYGLWISDSNTAGNLFGYGTITNYSSTATAKVNGLGGYPINISSSSLVNNIRSFESFALYNRGAIPFIRTSDTGSTNAVIRFNMNNGDIWSFNGGTAITVDGGVIYITNTQVACTGNLATGNALNYKFVSLNGARSVFKNVTFYCWGVFLGANNNECVKITNNNNNNSIDFNQCIIRFASAQSTSKLVFFDSNSGINKVTFYNCLLQQAGAASGTIAGNGFSSINPISIKIIDTYATSPSGGAIITNLITTGNGLRIEPNL